MTWSASMWRCLWDGCSKSGLGAPPGDLTPLWRFVPSATTTDFNMYFHSDGETAEMVPRTGLEPTTRAYAMIIDKANALPLADLQRAEEPAGP